MFDFIYLASQSPRRSQLLAQIGVRHELLVAGQEEDAEALEAEQTGELPMDYVERVTRAKLRAARSRLKLRGLASAPILCSDTSVVLGRRILGKPADAADALQTLSLLSGRTHRVITAVVVGNGRQEWLAVNVSRVRFMQISAVQMETYIASGDPFGKAGAYAIQSAAATWISHIEGSYSGIMGLPLYETAQLLRRARVRFSGCTE